MVSLLRIYNALNLEIVLSKLIEVTLALFYREYPTLIKCLCLSFKQFKLNALCSILRRNKNSKKKISELNSHNHEHKCFHRYSYNTTERSLFRFQNYLTYLYKIMSSAAK